MMKYKKYKVTVETTIEYQYVLEFEESYTKKDIRSCIECELGEYSEIFKDENIIDNYSNVTDVDLLE